MKKLNKKICKKQARFSIHIRFLSWHCRSITPYTDDQLFHHIPKMTGDYNNVHQRKQQKNSLFFH
jgi:hypothetical protein